MDSTDFEDFMDFFWIFSGFFDEVYGIFGVKCPSERTTYGISNYFEIKASITIKHKYKKTKQTY